MSITSPLAWFVLLGLAVALLAAAAQLDAVYLQHHPELHGVSPGGLSSLGASLAAVPVLFRGRVWRAARLLTGQRQLASSAMVLVGATVAYLGFAAQSIVESLEPDEAEAVVVRPSIALVAASTGGAGGPLFGWATIVDAVTLVVLALAALLAWRQVRMVRRVAQEERTLELHWEWSDGAVASARERLSTLMVDPEAVTTSGPVFYRLDWGALAANSAPPLAGRPVGHRSDLDQVFAVLWFFQRLQAARGGRVASPALAARLFEHDIAWWAAAIARFPPRSTHLLSHLQTLHADLRLKNPHLCTTVDGEFHAGCRPASRPTGQAGQA